MRLSSKGGKIWKMQLGQMYDSTSKEHTRSRPLLVIATSSIFSMISPREITTRARSVGQLGLLILPLSTTGVDDLVWIVYCGS